MTETPVPETKDPLRVTLNKLVEISEATFTADDVLREFRNTKKRNDRKLLKILEIISKYQAKRLERLQEAVKLLEKKDPFYCLITFLNHYSQANLLKTAPGKEFSDSTPTFSKPIYHGISDKKDSGQAGTSGSFPKQDKTNPGISFEAFLRSSSTSCSSTGVPLFSMPKSSTGTGATDGSVPNSENFPFEQSNIAGVPIGSQEHLLLFDLIYALTGIEGSYITSALDSECDFAPDGMTIHKFTVSEQVHSSLRDIAEDILPLASHYVIIQEFIDKVSASNCTQVLQALGQALSDLIQDYFLLLAQLESEHYKGNLSMHKMLFYSTPTLKTMTVLSHAVGDIVVHDWRGGRALTSLFEQINKLTGDNESQKFIVKLLKPAAVPYMSILQLWIQKGVIHDPQQEFMVEDNEVIRREELPEHYSSDYWEKRYTIRHERIPCFLEKVSDVILRTGKYLNVIRQCGKNVQPPPTIHLEFVPNSQQHICVIHKAYRFASKNLLQVLLKENDLMGHLSSVKHYLLLHQGDFITQFMDACEDELAKNVDKVLPMTLENLLGLTLRLSSAKHDPYKDDVHCELLTYDLVTQMSKIIKNEEECRQTHAYRLDLNGLECFAFRYVVNWPISLILNHIAISKYQMLFRQLFYCKHVERQLCKIWKDNSVVKKFSPQVSRHYRAAFILRQRMMNAIQNLEYYMMIEVIEPNWHTFIEKLKKIKNVDEVLSFHQDFLDSCLKNCMLTDTTTLSRSIFKLCKSCLRFCEFKQSESSLAATDAYEDRVRCFDLEFTDLLLGLLKQINDLASDNPADRFINLVHRINFNAFYNEQMDNSPAAKDSMN